jgi:N-acetylglucosamine-6-sulfatase
LASEGILFSNAFVTTSLCSPSRASFLTGQYAHTHGVRDNVTPWNDENQTFFELLKEAGYESAFIGKWHMPGTLPTLRGVDLFVTFTVQNGQGKYFDCPLVVDGVEKPSRKPYITEELTDYALDFVSEPRNGPFCLVLSHKAVHHRWLPPPDLADLYENDEPPFPREVDPLVFMTGGNLFEGLIGPPAELYRDYARVVTSLDREIGRLMERIDELGIANNTIVVFASDNGFFWGEHRRGGTGRWPYEESIRIPFIVRAPGVIKDPGRRADQMILNIDLAPSLLEMVGLPSPDGMEGESFVPVLKSRSFPGRRAWLYEYFADFPFRVPTAHAVRTERYIYIEFEGRRGRELYDIENDPNQLKDMIHTQEGQVMAGELKEILEDLRGNDVSSDPAREETTHHEIPMQ